jgi:hypothetical protein
MSEWMDDFIDKRTKKQGESARKASRTAAALASVPKMLRELTEELKKDCLQFSTATGIPILTVPIPNGLRIEHGKYPYFCLIIENEQAVPFIQCTQTVKKTSSDAGQPKISEIQIICDGQDELYYQLKGGEPVPHVSVISSSLLAPLLDLLS